MNGLAIILVNLLLFSHSSSKIIDIIEDALVLRPRSLNSPIFVLQTEDCLQICFDLYNIDVLDIKIENTMTSKVMYTYSLNPQQETTLYIPISDWESGSYTIYFVNPINDLYMYGEFYKE